LTRGVDLTHLVKVNGEDQIGLFLRKWKLNWENKKL